MYCVFRNVFIDISFYWVNLLQTIRLRRGCNLQGDESVDTGKGKHPPKVPNSGLNKALQPTWDIFQQTQAHVYSQEQLDINSAKLLFLMICPSAVVLPLYLLLLCCCCLWPAYLMSYDSHVAAVVDCDPLICCCITTPAVFVDCYPCICCCVLCYTCSYRSCL